MRLLTALASFLSFALAARHTSPPSGATIVSKKASSGQFSTLQTAVNSLSTTSTTPQSIFIYQGTYKEQVLIPARAAQLTIYGYTEDSSTYKQNTVTISFNKDAGSAGSNDASGTLRNKAANTKIYNLNIANTFGSGSQAIALSAQNTRQGYYACQMHGYQDTLLAETGTQFYGASLITGRTDFIFGQTSPAWFEGCSIGVLPGGTGWITASGRSAASNPNFYVFNNCSVGPAPGVGAGSVKAGAYFLGRPWREYARVVFQECELGDVVNAAGWAVWNKGDERTGYVEFGEFQNRGEGAEGTRAGFSKRLGGAVKMSTVLGSGYEGWVDSEYY